MQTPGFDANGLPRDPAGTDRRTPGRCYATGGTLLVISVLIFTFLARDMGGYMVLLGIFAAVAGAVFLVMGVQAAKRLKPDTLEQDYYNSPRYGQPRDDAAPPATYDWDSDYRREFGGGNQGR